MIKSFRFKSLVIFLFFSVSINALIDNRYFPLYRQRYTRQPDKLSIFDTNVFLMTASRARGFDDKPIGIPELDGKYDLIRVGKALEITGKENPVPDEWQSKNQLLLDMNGKLSAQGFWIGYEQALTNWFSPGISFYFMSASSRYEFVIPDILRRELKLDQNRGSEIVLEKTIAKANDLLGITDNQFKKSGVPDIDLYIRFGIVRDYVHKFRKIDLGFTIGMLIPSGPKIEINNPASVPFGANGHWGLYFDGEAFLELKDDFIVGLWIQFVKRFEKTSIRRIPVNGEPLRFGALVGPVQVNPGLTFGISPFVDLEGIRDALGVKARYTFIHHAEDHWIDVRDDQTIPSMLFTTDGIETHSVSRSWINEYITLSLIYNFANEAKCRKFTPIVYLDWDIPVRILASKNICKTHRVSLGFEFSF